MKRTKDPADGRAVAVELTMRGRELESSAITIQRAMRSATQMRDEDIVALVDEEARDNEGIRVVSLQVIAGTKGPQTAEIELEIGGVVKHHIMNANLMRNGTDHCVYINTGQEVVYQRIVANSHFCF